ncbi:MAG: single-stranded DNA-binding protein [Acidimicrobiia bacterium]
MEINLVVVQGPLSGPPEVRTLPSGTSVGTLGVRTHAGERATSVPVTVWDPPAWLVELGEGDVVIVLGAVRRRFYRAGAGTGSRVDVESAFIGRAGKRQRGTVAKRIEASLEALTGGG